jgi:hypothetical protein
MRDHLKKEFESRLTSLIADAFKRSIAALEEAGAIDIKKLRKQYTGSGSQYYDDDRNDSGANP